MIEFIMNGGLVIQDDTTRHIVETALLLSVALVGFIIVRSNGVSDYE